MLLTDCHITVCISMLSCLLGYEEKERIRERVSQILVVAEFVLKDKFWNGILTYTNY